MKFDLIFIIQLQSSSQAAEQTTEHIHSLLHLVTSQLHLPRDSQSRPGQGEDSARRQGRSRRTGTGRTRRRSRQSGAADEDRGWRQKPLTRSKSCAVQDDIRLLPGTERNIDENDLQSAKKIRKPARSKSTAFDFKDASKNKNDKEEPSNNTSSINANVKSGPGKTLRRIKTFLSKSRKYQFENEEKFCSKYVHTK